MRKVILLLALPLLLLTSCKEDVSDVFVMAKDVDNTSFVQSGNKLLIRVQAISDNYKVDRIRIYSVDAEKGSVQLKDTLVGGVKQVDFYFMYTVPSYFISDTAALTLQFEAVASNGGSSKMALAYKVVGGASLIHYDGIVMYGARSGRPNGFSLSKAQTLLCETSDSSLIDIYDYPSIDAATTAGRLSREWRSRTGLQFARMNDFDYSGTNQLLLNNAFKASRRYTSLKDIAEGDVVLFGREDQALGVLQVLMVVDEYGNTNDRYVFNLKKVRINNPTPEPDTTSTDTIRRFLR